MISGDELLDIKACHTGTLKKPAMIRSLLEDRVGYVADLVFATRVDPS